MLINDGLSLGIDENLQVDIVEMGNLDFGLYVGGTAPTVGVRANYITSHARISSQVLSAFFNLDGSVDITNGFAAPSDAGFDRLFIARTGADDYEAGFYIGTEHIAETVYTDLIVDRPSKVSGAVFSLTWEH